MSNNRRGNFIGHNGFVWWIGVVEDRIDPLNLGRCRVRIQGLHEETKSKVATNTLPWAQPLFSINGSTSTPSTLKEGDFVMGFFMDGAASQYPIIMGMFHGIPEDKPNREKGFNDPRTDEQLKAAPRKPKSIDYSKKGGAVITEHPAASLYPRLDQPTTSRLSRNESIDTTIIKTKNDSVKEAKAPEKGVAWKEPTSPYKTKYPYNQVVGTESGHYFELDDTPGAERIHMYHRSGTFSETHPNGSQVEKIVKDKYTIILNDNKVSISGDCSITIEGSNKVYIMGNCDTTVDGDYNLTVGKNMKISVGGTISQTSGSSTTLKGSTINLN